MKSRRRKRSEMKSETKKPKRIGKRKKFRTNHASTEKKRRRLNNSTMCTVKRRNITLLYSLSTQIWLTLLSSFSPSIPKINNQFSGQDHLNLPLAIVQSSFLRGNNMKDWNLLNMFDSWLDPNSRDLRLSPWMNYCEELDVLGAKQLFQVSITNKS